MFWVCREYREFRALAFCVLIGKHGNVVFCFLGFRFCSVQG